MNLSFSARRHLQVFIYTPSMAASNSVLGVRFNSDTGSNYNLSMITSGSYANSNNNSNISLDTVQNQYGRYCVMDITNQQSYIKLFNFRHNQTTGTTASGNMNSRYAWGGWFNASNQITSIQVSDIVNTGMNLPIGSYIVVLGHN